MDIRSSLDAVGFDRMWPFSTSDDEDASSARKADGEDASASARANGSPGRSGERSSAQPDGGSTTQPGSGSSAQPDGGSTTQPGSGSSAQPDGSSTAQSDGGSTIPSESGPPSASGGGLSRRVSRRLGIDHEKAIALAIFLLPGMTLFAIFSIGPIAYSAVGSFFSWDAFTMGSFTGVDNWIETFRDPLIINWDNLREFRFPMGALPQNLLWVVIHVPLSTLLGLGLALLFAGLKGRRILRSMVFLGFTTPTIIIGLIMLFIYDPQAGIFNELLRVIGLEGQVRNWTQSPQVAIYALIVGGVWVQTGFSMLLYSSALAAVDPSLIESAKIDGAGRLRRFRDIIWPQVRPVTAVVVIMGIIWVLRMFDIVYAAGGSAGGPNHVYSVLGIEVYRAAFEPPIQYGNAMVVALVELIIVAPLALYIARMR